MFVQAHWSWSLGRQPGQREMPVLQMRLPQRDRDFEIAHRRYPEPAVQPGRQARCPPEAQRQPAALLTSRTLRISAERPSYLYPHDECGEFRCGFRLT